MKQAVSQHNFNPQLQIQEDLKRVQIKTPLKYRRNLFQKQVPKRPQSRSRMMREVRSINIAKQKIQDTFVYVQQETPSAQTSRSNLKSAQSTRRSKQSPQNQANLNLPFQEQVISLITNNQYSNRSSIQLLQQLKKRPISTPKTHLKINNQFCDYCELKNPPFQFSAIQSIKNEDQDKITLFKRKANQHISRIFDQQIQEEKFTKRCVGKLDKSLTKINKQIDKTLKLGIMVKKVQNVLANNRYEFRQEVIQEMINRKRQLNPAIKALNVKIKINIQLFQSFSFLIMMTIEYSLFSFYHQVSLKLFNQANDFITQLAKQKKCQLLLTIDIQVNVSK